VITSATWRQTLGEEKEKPYFQEMMAHLQSLREAGTVIYPPKQDVFNAFKYTPLEKLKAVIIGQDPYHGPGQAHGLCFSVANGVMPPPSLKNIFKALHHDLNIATPAHGCLSMWAHQGVLLLNTVLTVEHGKAHSHSQLGWQRFTDKVIETIDHHVTRPVVYLLWGSHAIKKSILVNNQKHLVLQAPHPSPLSAHRGFLTCKHFSRANAWLAQHGSTEIDWQLMDS
tara:strand:+ start:49 stop:726 length:678 start_codon:yes stop_codon:yes gene_type:complete